MFITIAVLSLSLVDALPVSSSLSPLSTFIAFSICIRMGRCFECNLLDFGICLLVSICLQYCFLLFCISQRTGNGRSGHGSAFISMFSSFD